MREIKKKRLQMLEAFGARDNNSFLLNYYRLSNRNYIKKI